MNMKEISKRLKEMKLGSYFRELSIVIIGVAVTLYAGSVITGIKEQKDLDLQLNAIYSELEENSRRLDVIIEYHKEHELLRNYLFKVVDDPEIYNNDTIIKYDNVLSTTTTFSYKRGAFDMFVNSGAMKLLSDRKQLLEITESYAMLDEFKHDNDLFFELKTEILGETYRMDRKLIFEKGSDLRSPHWNTKFNFHLLNNGMEESAIKVKQELEKALSKQKYTWEYIK